MEIHKSIVYRGFMIRESRYAEGLLWAEIPNERGWIGFYLTLEEAKGAVDTFLDGSK